jgi:allophanate hydrolase subunit 1
MFDAARDPMSWLRIADRVRFQPIDAGRYQELLG